MTLSFEEIKNNISKAQRNIQDALEKRKDLAKLPRLMVVSKGQPIEAVLRAKEAGITLFGENYPEQSLEKIHQVHGVEWHMIGHLQSRKAKIVADHFDMMESVDSIEIAMRLNRMLADNHRVMPILIEVNIAGEAGKSGFPGWDDSQTGDLKKTVLNISQMNALSIRGIMVMPPLLDDSEQVRQFFTRARLIRDRLQDSFPALKLDELSMGTSHDYPVAVEEGATIVRLGSCILGPRPDRKMKQAR